MINAQNERTNLDIKNVYGGSHRGLIGKVFYHRCPDNENYFRSIRIAHNPFTNNLQPQISNAVYGEPPSELEPIPPSMLNRLMRVQMSSAFM